MRGSLWSVCVCFLVLGLLALVSGQTDPGFTPSVDRISARTARIRWLISSNQATPTLTATIIQYSNDTTRFGSSLQTFYTATLIPDDHQLVIPVTSTPLTSYVLRNLNPSSSYQVRVGYLGAASASTTPLPNPSPTTVGFNTPALSSIVDLSTLLVSGGCGQLTATGALYYMNKTTDASTGTSITVYSCDVVTEINNVTIAIVPKHAYATVSSTEVSPVLTASNLTLSVTSTYADPLVQYNTTLLLDVAGATTNFTWNVTSESGLVQTYLLSVRRAGQLTTAQIAGPSSPVVAMIRSPTTATSLQYLGLTWSGTVISKWKAWSDDLTIFPYSAFTWTAGATSSSTSNTLQVTPATNSVPDGTCSNVYVALFDTAGNSFTSATCISALDDYCSSTPFGAATKWQNPWANTATLTLPGSTSSSAASVAANLYYPVPPYPTFPSA